jgi:hypothetical protein
MQSNRARAAVAVAAVALVVVLFIVLNGGGEDEGGGASVATTSEQPAGEDADGAGSADDGEAGEAGEGSVTTKQEPQDPTIVVRAGEPVGGVAELTFDKGDAVRFRVRSDVAEEIHVHGYDIVEEVEAGGSVRFDFPAEIDGVFEVELEQSATEIAELRIEP